MVRKSGDLIVVGKFYLDFCNFNNTPLIYLGPEYNNIPSIKRGRKVLLWHGQENRVIRLEEKLLDDIERKKWYQDIKYKKYMTSGKLIIN